MENFFNCKVCGWAGLVNGRPRCLSCYAKRMSEWRKNNPDKAKEQKRRYEERFKKERPEEYRAKRRKKYLPKTAAKAYARRKEWLESGTVTTGDLKAIYALFNGQCAYCKTFVKPRFNAKDPRGFDHVKSRNNGGKHEASNLVVCCRRCNEIKR